MTKRKGAVALSTIVVILLLGIISWALLGKPGLPAGGSAVAGSVVAGSTALSACPNTNGVGTLRYLAKSPFTNSYYQPPVTYVYRYLSPDYLKGTTLSGTAGALSTETYDADLSTIECLASGEVITLGGTNSTGRKDVVPGVMGTQQYLKVEVPNSTALKMFVYDSAFANKTQTMDGVAVATTGGNEVTTVSTAMGANARTSWIVKLLPTAGYVFGNYQTNELIIAFDFDSTKFSLANGVTVSGVPGITEISATSYGMNGKEKAFKMPALMGGSLIGFAGNIGEQDLKVVINSDLGDPTTSVTMYVYQPGWFQDTDGTYKYGIFDSATSLKIGGANTVTFTIT